MKKNKKPTLAEALDLFSKGLATVGTLHAINEAVYEVVIDMLRNDEIHPNSQELSAFLDLNAAMITRTRTIAANKRMGFE